MDSNNRTSLAATEGTIEIIPNQGRKVDLLFRNWLFLPETQKALEEELNGIDPNLSEEFQKTVKAGMTGLVGQISEMNIEHNLATTVPAPEPIPNLFKPAGFGNTESGNSSTLQELKKDSGIALDEQMDKSVEAMMTDQMVELPPFYFPYGRASVVDEMQSKDDWKEAIIKIFEYSSTNAGKKLLERDFLPVTQAVGLSKYLNTALFRKSSIGSDGVTYWESIIETYHSDAAIAYAILKDPRNSFLRPEDIAVCIQDVTLNHPGLQFLSSMSVFQNRYIETVLTRFMYSRRQNCRNTISLNEFEKSGFVTMLKNLDNVSDVNASQDIFSYQHFYVIYCKFWELDEDHDMMIDREDLARYDRRSMTEAIISRVMAGYGKPPAKGSNSGIMTYEDFIWFILSVEDKKTPQSIEYWFRCVDLDGDGVISLHELHHFYEEQYRQMLRSRISEVWKFEDFICSLYFIVNASMDLVKPKTPNQITLQCLKKCGSAHLFFNMLFDLRRYDLQMQRIDPMFRDLDEIYAETEDGEKIKLDGFRKFAARTYQLLAMEDSGSGSQKQDDDEYDCGMGIDYDSSWADEDFSYAIQPRKIDDDVDYEDFE